MARRRPHPFEARVHKAESECRAFARNVCAAAELDNALAPVAEGAERSPAWWAEFGRRFAAHGTA